MNQRIVIFSAALFGLILLARGGDREGNIVPGEENYPSINKNPQHSLRLSLLIPSSLHLNFYAVYSATMGRDSLTKPRECHFETRQGTETEYSVSQKEFFVRLPVELTFENDEPDKWSHSRDLKRYKSAIFTDQFQKRHCLWNFDKLVYSIDGEEPENPDIFIFGSPNGLSDESLESTLPNGVVMSCMRRPATRETRRQVVCTNSQLRGWLVPYLRVKPGLTKLPLEFVDLDNRPADPRYEMRVD